MARQGCWLVQIGGSTPAERIRLPRQNYSPESTAPGPSPSPKEAEAPFPRTGGNLLTPFAHDPRLSTPNQPRTSRGDPYGALRHESTPRKAHRRTETCSRCLDQGELQGS